MILENPFTSISTLVDEHFPFLSKFKNLILRIQWNTIHRIRNIKIPILLIAGGKDTKVKLHHSEQLLDAAKRCNEKKLFVVEEGTHVDTWQKGGKELVGVVKEFVDKAYEIMEN